ncbi:UNVERIFIED_CONTAM: Beta carbonic anhydrase 5, chloroplastic [Sesamum radiatum]|uniref:Carbonic anhydrase n=1 Tax=Sesamum radiatum TaxID=300843 RepID=A0AAW2RY58_SESRA
MAHAVLQSSSLSCSSSMDRSRTSVKASDIFGSQLRSPEIEQTHLRCLGSFKRDLEYYRRLSEAQAPKFMVIACADSRVCPSSILGFQPGEAFVVRNVANLVPPHEVENILVVGHSCCGGIKALMSLEDDADSSSFIRSWVTVGKHARFKTKDAASNLNFDQQCRHCEKESINRSLLNLLSYPWIEERVIRGKLSIHGGYYDFIDCTFEKWTLDYKGSGLLSSAEYSIKNREFWA